MSEETHDEIEDCLKVYCGCIPPRYLPYYGWNRRYRNTQRVDKSKAALSSSSSSTKKWKQKSKKSRGKQINDWLQNNEGDEFSDHKIDDGDDDDDDGYGDDDEFTERGVIDGNKSATAASNNSRRGNNKRSTAADALSTKGSTTAAAADVENDLFADLQGDHEVEAFDPFVMIGTNQEGITEAEPVICLYEGTVRRR